MVQKNKEVFILSLQNFSFKFLLLLACKEDLHITQPPNVQPNIFKKGVAPEAAFSGFRINSSFNQLAASSREFTEEYYRFPMVIISLDELLLQVSASSLIFSRSFSKVFPFSRNNFLFNKSSACIPFVPS